MSAPGSWRQARVSPVYAELRESLQPDRLVSANTGLIHDRYADIWSGAERRWKPVTGDCGPSARKQFLEAIRDGLTERRAAVGPLLATLHDRRAALWRQCGARVVDLALEAPLVSGLGMTHALDAGLVWERNLGIPFLPASSLKGAARAWAEQWGALDRTTAVRIFGDLTDQGAGWVVFQALYPLDVPGLRLDVLNPHFGAYYRDPGTAPADWLSPEPVFFLTVMPGTRFRTALLSRAEAGGNDLDMATDCLREALANLGAGAKTALGYGVFGAVRPGAAPTAAARMPARAAPPPAQVTPASPPQPSRPPAPPDPPRQPAGPPTLEDLARRYSRQQGRPEPREQETRQSRRAREEQARIMERQRRQAPEQPGNKPG